jgi:hypothetical protein
LLVLAGFHGEEAYGGKDPSDKDQQQANHDDSQYGAYPEQRASGVE